MVAAALRIAIMFAGTAGGDKLGSLEPLPVPPPPLLPPLLLLAPPPPLPPPAEVDPVLLVPVVTPFVLVEVEDERVQPEH